MAEQSTPDRSQKTAGRLPPDFISRIEYNICSTSIFYSIPVFSFVLLFSFYELFLESLLKQASWFVWGAVLLLNLFVLLYVTTIIILGFCGPVIVRIFKKLRRALEKETIEELPC